ncbi:MAG: dynamin family protein [Fusobacteriaceae bacterium]
MKQIEIKVNELKELYLKYNKDNEELDKILEEMKNFKINLPLIGGFSSGKSSLINALLGRKILKTKITPETAIPTEIEYSENEFVRIYNKNEDNQDIFLKEISVQEFEKTDFNIEEFSKVSLGLNNEFLKKNKEIRIVDMPGLDSGILAHNNAIDSYIGNSIAYLIVCDAEQGTVRKSILEFLEELKHYKKPIYAVLNKMDKLGSEESVEKVIEECKSKIEKILDGDIEVSAVSARKKQISSIEKYIRELDEQSSRIFTEYFEAKLSVKKDELKKYLETLYHNIGKDNAEIEKEIKDFEKNLESLEVVFGQKSKELEKNLKSSSSRIKVEIQNKLTSNVDNFAYSIAQGGDISSEINQIIRTTIASEMNNNVEENIEKFLSEMAEGMQINMSPIQVDTKGGVDGKTIATLQTAVAGATTALLSTFAAVGAFAGPIGIAAGILVGLAVKIFMDKSSKEKQQEESKNKIRAEIPGIVSNVETSINKTFIEIISNIKEKVKIEMDRERENILKALELSKNRLKKENEEEEKEKQNIYDDIEMLKNLEI